MKTNYRSELFEAYGDHVTFVEPDHVTKMQWFQDQAEINYLPHLRAFGKDARILEVGCNRGLLLAALKKCGFHDLHGVDLSPQDVAKAQSFVPGANISCVDAAQYLQERKQFFDVIITKAVLEHIEKDNVLPLLQRIANGLRAGGVAIIDVPNMDWLFANHERYMDFTHETGFTRESLSQLMRVCFSSVHVLPGQPVIERGRLNPRIAALLRPAAVAMMTLLFKILGEGAGNVWWQNRSLIGVGSK